MAKREKQKAKIDHEKEEEEEKESKSSKSIIQVSSSDDEEANEDLTLKIVEKSLLMRAAKLSQNDDDDNNNNNDAVSGDKIDVVDLSSDSPQEAEEVVVSKKKIKRTKKKVIEKISVTVAKEEEMNADEKSEKAEVVEDHPNSVEISNNIVLRKLLRGARYFDMPDNGGWETCYNCGEEGHMAVNCTSAVKRKKPCYVCGSLDHAAKKCTKGQDCYICKKGGHRAKDCPEKYKIGSQNAKICLKCGYYGHDMFSCKNHYSHDDLKEIQCYICKSLGHLCCVNSLDSNPREVSCYKCGQLGHTGLACGRLRGETTGLASSTSCYKCGGEGHFARECTSSAMVGRLRGETTGTASPSSCYKCGEGGHFARECTSSAMVGRLCGETTGMASPSSCYKCGGEGHFARECISSAMVGRLRGETTGTASPSSCYNCGGEGHFARECISSAKAGKRNCELSTPTLRPHREHKDRLGFKSAPHDLDKAHKRKKTQYEEGGSTTPRKSKHRGGWITEDPGDFSGRESKKDRWKSPATPSKERHKISTLTAGGHISSPKSFKNRTSNHRFSASRFHNSGSDEKRRNYNWW